MRSITFGKYPQDSASVAERIEWDVLEDTEDSMLLITKKCIDAKNYHESDSTVEWANCDLRRWLNDEFYSMAFTPSERKRIIEVDNENHMVTAYGALAKTERTIDKVFLLSEEEAKRFYHVTILEFFEKAVLQAPVTKYAMLRGADYDVFHARGDWWLRTSVVPNSAMRIGFLGIAWVNGKPVNDGDGSIRPVIRIKK